MEVFPFSIEWVSGMPVHGGLRYMLGLPDGREAGLWCDRVEVTSGGALIVYASTWRNTGSIDAETVTGDERVVLAMASGTWVSIYAADVIAGDPISIDSLEASPED